MYRIVILSIVLLAANAGAESGRSLVEKGNQLYVDGEFESAIEIYSQAAEGLPKSTVPEFNKANSLYKLENLEEAIEHYKQVAADSSDKKIVSAAKYNLGNSFFQKALKNQQEKPEETLKDMKTSIGYFRDVLDTEPANPNAAQNIEVAKTVYKQIKEQQQQQQQQDQDQQQDKDGDEQDKDKQDQQQEQDDQDKQDQQNQDQSEQQQGDKQDQEQQQQDQEQPAEPMEQQMVPDATAQQILDKEKEQKKERQILQSSGLQKVEKDW